MKFVGKIGRTTVIMRMGVDKIVRRVYEARIQNLFYRSLLKMKQRSKEGSAIKQTQNETNKDATGQEKIQGSKSRKTRRINLTLQNKRLISLKILSYSHYSTF